MNKDILNQLMAELAEQPYLSAGQIPKLNLYIDQILTLFSEGSAEEQALTKSMVNNYSKEKMLRPIKGKTYNREQILQILLICRLKPVLTMEQIKCLTHALMKESGEEVLEEILCLSDERKSAAFSLAEQWLNNREFPQNSSDASCVELILELSHLSQLFALAARVLTEQQFKSKEQQ